MVVDALLIQITTAANWWFVSLAGTYIRRYGFIWNKGFVAAGSHSPWFSTFTEISGEHVQQ